MKYMGSKRTMLQNGLGELLAGELRDSRRFIDLFSGSGAVSWHVASKYSVPVHAYDLQNYSAVLAAAVLKRRRQVRWEAAWKLWRRRAYQRVNGRGIPKPSAITRAIVTQSREWCAGQKGFPITQAYGGHYFSPQQATWLDALRATLPAREPIRTVALAALIQASSRCAAAPGHTAQPFQPTRSAKPFLENAWKRDICNYTKAAFNGLAQRSAKVRGSIGVADANVVAASVRKKDLVFIDPPYSDVHYSRFYHVLETVALGECKVVSGVGRYPDVTLRPSSKYSRKREAPHAIDALLKVIALNGAKAVLTFPDHDCSNGLSGSKVRRIAAKYFFVRAKSVNSELSTMGGRKTKTQNLDHRHARLSTSELILVLRPKRAPKRPKRKKTDGSTDVRQRPT